MTNNIKKTALMEVTSLPVQEQWLSNQVADFLATAYPEHFVRSGAINYREINRFVAVGLSLGVNPLSGDLYPVTFKKESDKITPVLKYTAAINRVREDKEYVSHHFVDVYEQSKVTEKDGTIEVTCDKFDPGQLVGCIIYIRTKSLPNPICKRVIFREWDEIAKSKVSSNSSSPWRDHSGLMITKTVLIQTCRLLFGNTVPSGVLTEEEVTLDAQFEVVKSKPVQMPRPEAKLPAPEKAADLPTAPPIQTKKAKPAAAPPPPEVEPEPEKDFAPDEVEPEAEPATSIDDGPLEEFVEDAPEADPLFDLRQQAKDCLKNRFQSNGLAANRWLKLNKTPKPDNCDAEQLQDIIRACGNAG